MKNERRYEMSLPHTIVLQPINWNFFLFFPQPFALARIFYLSSLFITGLISGLSHFSVCLNVYGCLSFLLLVLPSHHCSTGIMAPKSFRN